MTNPGSDAESASETTPPDVFDPVGYVVLAFGNAADAATSQASLLGEGCAAADLLRYSGGEVLEESEAAKLHRGLLSYLREEHELAEEYEAIARDGGAFLLVRVDSDAQAAHIAEVGRRGDLKRAAYYGPMTFTVLG